MFIVLVPPISGAQPTTATHDDQLNELIETNGTCEGVVSCFVHDPSASCLADAHNEEPKPSDVGDGIYP